MFVFIPEDRKQFIFNSSLPLLALVFVNVVDRYRPLVVKKSGTFSFLDYSAGRMTPELR